MGEETPEEMGLSERFDMAASEAEEKMETPEALNPDTGPAQGMGGGKDPFNRLVLKQSQNYNKLLLLNARELGLRKQDTFRYRDAEAMRLLRGINTSVYPTTIMPGVFAPAGGNLEIGRDLGLANWIVTPRTFRSLNGGLYPRHKKLNTYQINPITGKPWIWGKSRKMPPKGINNGSQTNQWWCPQ